jgi:hypothetical protein
MTTHQEERVIEELARQLHEELLRRGHTEESAHTQVAAAVEMWRRGFDKPH